jgi:maltose alpha-D-glucosyltransferase / alpha-amylase
VPRRPDDDRDRPPDDPHWYRDAVIYELHVRSFADSNGDGIGDFAGLTAKLDYLQDLGVTALWLLPFYPSPLRDDGYDIADYTAINPDYGTMRQFKRFVKEAHDRGLKVITELVINHTSDQHPWFQRAVKAPKGSRSATSTSGATPRPLARRPHHLRGLRDLELDLARRGRSSTTGTASSTTSPTSTSTTPRCSEAVKDVLDFWAETGVDGMRLDAIPYLFERDGTNGENLPETHEFLKELRATSTAPGPDVPRRGQPVARGRRRLLRRRRRVPHELPLPADAAAVHGGAPGGPLPDRRHPAADPGDPRGTASGASSCATTTSSRSRWSPTRSATTCTAPTRATRDMRINLGIRRRLAPLLGNDRRLIELMNSLLFSLPGTPVLYYGDEIGMGDNVYLGDRNGVRTPMQWSATATPASPAPTRSGCTCRPSSTPSTTTSRSTSRRSRTTRARCCGG